MRRSRLKGALSWCWAFCLASVLGLISGISHAALDAPTQRGLDWLSNQIQASGQLAGEGTSPALPMQVRSETALTLRALPQTIPPALLSAIDGIQPATTEYLARKALAKQLAGGSDAAALNALEQLQNADGGYGAAAGFASNPQDTAWALRALQASRKTGISAMKALAWAQTNQQSDGAWKLMPDGDTLVPTALMAQTLVLYRYQQAATQAALTKAQTWLIAQRNAAQTWGDDHRTAQGLLAVLPGLGTFTSMEPTLAALRQAQRADGSWAGDPYVTALALRALVMAALGPQNPGDPVTTGTLQGTTKGDNGQPLTGVSVAAVSAAGGAPKLATSDAQGNYAITGLPAGAVSISAAKDGYSQVNASGTIVAGQVLLFSPVLTHAVTVTPGTAATVTGTVKDGVGQPLAGVVITATPTSGTAVTATTDAQGNYGLVVPAGNIRLNASKNGYVNVAASITLPAGSTGIFSPALATGVAVTPPTIPGGTTATVAGTVKDGAGQPLAGVLINATPTGGAAVSTTTDAQGTYRLTVAAGTVKLNASKNGYVGVDANATLPAGSSGAFSPVLTAGVSITPGGTNVTITGTVKDGVGQPLAGAVVTATPAGGTAITATTDAQGAYSLTVPAGTIRLNASKNGYVDVDASATLPAGSSTVFSPTLVSNSSPGATQVAISGKVVSATGRTPLAAVTVTAETTGGTAVTASTDSNGRFALNVAAGSITLSYVKSGYASVTQQATAQPGAKLDAGVVELPVARSTSSLRGVVTDMRGAPISGAIVDAAGKVATANAAGAYVIPELTGTSVSVNVTAAGFLSRSYQLTIATPGDIVQDFVLPDIGGSGFLELENLRIVPASAGLNQEVVASVTIRNTSVTEAESAVMLEVQDPSGRVLTQLSGLDSADVPVGTLKLAASEHSSVRFKWNTASAPAGTYTFLVKLYVPGSRSTDNPSGTVTGSLLGQLVVSQAAHFSGTAMADPPVVQAGAATPVKLSALVKNDGNVSLPASEYRLTVLDTKNNAVLHQATANGPSLSLSALATLEFGTWNPSVSGSYRLEVTAVTAPGSKIVAPLYVGDVAKAHFKVDKAVVPPGTQQVKGSIQITGIDMASGTSVDPLAAVIRDAVVKAVNYGDNYAYNHYIGDLKCYACHVQTQAVVGGERNLRFAPPLDPNKRSALVNAISQNMRADGGVVYSGSTYIRVTTALGLWAAKDWHAPEDLKLSDRRMAEFLMSQASSSGTWTADYGGHWWGSQGQLTGLNISTLIDYAGIVKRHGVGADPTLGSPTIQGLPNGDMRLAAGPDGTIYVAHVAARAVYRIQPGSTNAERIIGGLPVTSIQFTSDGRLLLASTSGVYLSDLSGQHTKLHASPATGAIEDGSGGYLVRLSGTQKISQLDTAGNLTDFIQNSVLTTTAGALQKDYDGSILAIVPNANRVVRFNADGSFKDVPIAYANGTPKSLTPYQGGYLVGTAAGLFVYSDEWVTERWTFSDTGGAAVLPGGEVWANASSQILPLYLVPADANRMLLSLDDMVGRTATSLVSGQIFNANHNLDQAFRLLALAKTKAFYQGTARAKEFDALMAQIGQTLWSRQKANGGWSISTANGNSDPVATAIVGVALDTLNPSRADPKLRRAIEYVLSTQRGDGSWLSTNGLGGTLLSSTWIEIWLPTMLDRLGSIDGDLHVTFAPDVGVANPEPPPSSTVTQPDGSVEYVWRLTGVTGAGRDVEFDLTLMNMGEQETRAVARQASLIFANSFVDGEVVSPVVVPRVASNASIDLTVSTDKPSYTSAETAVFTAPVTNGGVVARDVQVRFTVLDQDRKIVAVLPLPAVATVGVGMTVPVSALWSAADVLAGPYVVLAELVSADGSVYGSAEAPFNVVAGPGPANATRISTDRQRYSLAQPIQVQSLAGNVSVNVLQEALSAETVVTDAQGREVFRTNEAIAQLPANALRQYVYGIAAGSLPAGVYQARLSLLGPAGYRSKLRTQEAEAAKANPGDTLLSESVTSFQVVAAATCAQGITGALLPQPSLAPLGQPVALALTLDNPGANALQSATLRLRIVDANTGTLIDEQSVGAVNVTASGQWHHQWRWQAKGTAGQTLVAIATLETAGCADVVAHASITLAAAGPRPGPGPGPGTVVGVPLDVRLPLVGLLVVLGWLTHRRRSAPPMTH